MKQITRRDKLKIYSDLLSVLSTETREEKIVLTHVQVQIGVPFDRLKIYISELDKLGLIQDQTSLRPTEKGKQYIVEYAKVLDFMKRMGITYQ